MFLNFLFLAKQTSNEGPEEDESPAMLQEQLPALKDSVSSSLLCSLHPADTGHSEKVLRRHDQCRDRIPGR